MMLVMASQSSALQTCGSVSLAAAHHVKLRCRLLHHVLYFARSLIVHQQHHVAVKRKMCLQMLFSGSQVTLPSPAGGVWLQTFAGVVRPQECRGWPAWHLQAHGLAQDRSASHQRAQLTPRSWPQQLQQLLSPACGCCGAHALRNTGDDAGVHHGAAHQLPCSCIAVGGTWPWHCMS